MAAQPNAFQPSSGTMRGEPPGRDASRDVLLRKAAREAAAAREAQEAGGHHENARREASRREAEQNARQHAYPNAARPSDTRHQVPQAQEDGEVSFTGYCEVLCLALQREELRRDRKYKESDKVRNILCQMGVEIQDTLHTFTFGTLTGSYDLNTDNIGAQELQYVALEREEARRDRMYDVSDSLREWLNDQGVRVEDKSKVLTLEKDGATGSYDLHDWRPMVDAGSNGGGAPPKRQRHD